MHPSTKRTTGVVAVAGAAALIAMHLAVGAVLIKGLFEIPAFAPGR